MLAGLQLFPNLQQFLIVIFSYPGRVDTYPDMTETFILVEHGLDFPGIDKSGKVVVHIKGNTPYLRVAFQERSQRHMGSTAQRQEIGHESVEITYRYAHLFPTIQTEMAENLNQEREEYLDE